MIKIAIKGKNAMFYYLMICTFVLALLVSFAIMKIFSHSINQILARIINDPIHEAWAKYTKFAGMVVGTSSGIRIYDMEKYITPSPIPIMTKNCHRADAATLGAGNLSNNY